MTVVLRPATREDVPLLESWDDDPDVHASSPNDDWDWEGQTLIQLTDLAPDASKYWGEHQAGLMAIDIEIGEPDMRGKGYGRTMMGLALILCFSDPTIQAVLIDPLVTNTRAIAFYERLGFTFLENRWFGKDYCAVHQITRAKYEQGTPQ
jgi:aminoglycoside 6'-N-acetyltransferase